MSNDGEKKIEVELRRNAAANKRHNYELRAQTDTMSYSGTNYGPQVGPKFPHNKGPKLLVGVHDKRTGVVRLVAAQQYQMRELRRMVVEELSSRTTACIGR